MNQDSPLTSAPLLTQGCNIYSIGFLTLRDVSVASSESSCPSNSMLDLGVDTTIHCPLGLWIPPSPLALPRMSFTGCPNKCAAGHFGNTTQEKDYTCSGKCNGGGQYCPAATVQPLLCPAGTYLNVGVTGLAEASCIPCAPGAYNPDEGGTRCLTCPAGKLSESASSTECNACPRGGSCSAEGAAPPSPWLWALLPLSVLLVAGVVLFVLCYRRISRDRANLRISRDRANLDLQMISHQVQIRVETQSEDSVSLPDSLPAKRSISLRKAPAASLPPGPPSSSTGQSVAEQEVTRSGSADIGVAPAAPTPLAAPTVEPSPSLRHASSSAPPKRPAKPESASAKRIKKAFTSPWHVYCQEQRPLLMPLGMRNRDRERLLGVLAP